MAEPGRKIDKGRHASTQTVVAQNAPPPTARDKSHTNGADNENPFAFWSITQEDPVLVDLNEFATGKMAADVVTGKHKWKGDFRGRPSLIAELLPTIQYLHGLNRGQTFKIIQLTLRFWWRVFDVAESHTTASSHVPRPVESVADIQMIHHHIAKKRGVSSSTQNQFLRIVNLTRSQKKLPPLYWPTIEPKRTQSEVPETWEVERIRHALKRQWFLVLSRWKAADASEASLWGWKESHKERSIHAHELYRAAIELTGHPLPSPDMIQLAIGYSSQIRWMQPYSKPIAGLYPTCDDVRAAFMLCLMYSGWNTSTLIDLKVDGRFVEVHPTNPGYHVVYGYKHRGKSEHHCIGRNKRSDAPGTILRTLFERTRPLRELVRKELTAIEAKLAEGAASARELNELVKQRKELMERVRSPWLYADPQKCAVLHLTPQSVNHAQHGTFIGNLIRSINLNQPADKQIRDSIVPGDFRDSYVGFAYEFSNYSVLTAQIAAGHKRVGTTQDYLRHRQWKAHSAKTIHKFQTAMFREIDERKSVDPTMLRALMEWEVVTDEERARLAEYRKNRSRIGVACKDPNNPPRSIARNHTSGGCRIQRCTLCPENAILLPDSYDGIAMRVAELECLRDNIPVTTWVNSGFPAELENSEAALELYDPRRVKERLTHWRGEIQSGRHKPIFSDGTY